MILNGDLLLFPDFGQVFIRFISGDFGFQVRKYVLICFLFLLPLLFHFHLILLLLDFDLVKSLLDIWIGWLELETLAIVFPRLIKEPQSARGRAHVEQALEVLWLNREDLIPTLQCFFVIL